jgi:hypothetical protein
VQFEISGYHGGEYEDHSLRDIEPRRPVSEVLEVPLKYQPTSNELSRSNIPEGCHLHNCCLFQESHETSRYPHWIIAKTVKAVTTGP